MATTNATIDLASDITDSALAVSNTTQLNTAGTTTGVNTMTSVTKVLSSTNQVDTVNFLSFYLQKLGLLKISSHS